MSLMCLAACLTLARQAFAAADDPLDRLFTIREVKVDETARSASRALNIAFEKAEEEAYNKLLVKLTQPEGRAKLPKLTKLERQSLISGIDVVTEQSSSTRYLATLNVRFEPQRVSEFFAAHGVPHVLAGGTGMLVLHAHTRGSDELMWRKDAVLDRARGSVDWMNRIRYYVFPVGRIDERMAVTYGEVKALDIDAAARLQDRYDVGGSLMITSRYEAEGATGTLHYRYISSETGEAHVGTIDHAASEEAALSAMYETVLDAIDSDWREQLLVDTGTGGEMTVVVPTTELKMLTEVEKRLSEISLVSQYRVTSLALPLSRITFRYTGREDQLATAMRYGGLTLGTYGSDRMLSLRSD